MGECKTKVVTGDKTKYVAQKCRKTVQVKVCAKWEQLYTCSRDEGRTQACEMYKRVSTEKGVCVGDKGKKGALQLDRHGRCPKGYVGVVSGEACECPTECGGKDNGFR